MKIRKVSRALDEKFRFIVHCVYRFIDLRHAHPRTDTKQKKKKKKKEKREKTRAREAVVSAKMSSVVFFDYGNIGIEASRFERAKRAGRFKN